MPILLIAEKDKAAKAIAEAIGTVSVIKKSKINIYYVSSKDLYVIPLRGHLLSYKNTEEYKSWTKSIPREIITNPNAIEKIPEKYAYPYIKALREYSKLCTECIISTDADIEGVNIGLFDAYPFVKQVNPTIKISQMWLNSLQKKEIQDKFNNLIFPKWSWGESGEARAIIDAVIGFSATRELTNTIQPLLKKFNRFFVSIGRVQTSLLYLIYLRDQLIDSFNPEQYFTIGANLIINNNTMKVSHKLNPFKKEKEVEAKRIFEDVKDEKTAKVINNDKSNKKKTPPTPLNTSKALVLLTKILKISPNLALKTMSDLYLNKIISYPRTDSDVYKSNFNHLEYLKKFSSHFTGNTYANYTSTLIRENRVYPTKGKRDAGDHPPITPLECLSLSSSKFENEIQKKVYDLLARHYLALFGKDATEVKTILNVSIKEEPFNGQFISLISEGFLEIAPFLKKSYNPEVNIIGTQIPIDLIFYEEKETQPPPRYTDTTLLKLMERNHLGTKATRPLIIQLLQDRKLIYRSNRQYFVSDLGEFLIENLKGIWLPFLEPHFTRFIEDLIEDIKEQRKKLNEVIDLVKKEFLELFDKFLINKKKLIPKINDFRKKLKDKSQKGVSAKDFPMTTSLCPHCKKERMKLISTKQGKRFLACANDKCEKKYLSVPKKGRIYILKSICSICGFNVFKITGRKNNKSFFYYICPNCWTEGLKEQTGIGFCSNCENFRISNEICIQK
ncbi:MAG: DNA topoisomerase [Promethearchaeota archaeon]